MIKGRLVDHWSGTGRKQGHRFGRYWSSVWLILDVGRVIGLVAGLWQGCRFGHWTAGWSDLRSRDGSCLQGLGQNQKAENK